VKDHPKYLDRFSINALGGSMQRLRFRILLIGACIVFSMLLPGTGVSADLKTKMLLSAVEMPPGFSIGLFAENVSGARSMALSPSGVVYVGTRTQGRVYAVIDMNGDFRADQVVTVAQGLNMPNGVALWDGDLYVAEVDRILRFNQIDAHLNAPGKPDVIYDKFPKDQHHGWKFIRFGPDGRLYVPVGAPCNVCRRDNPVYASITRINRDGSAMEIFAHGVRNSVGFDWHPRTGELWFTDNGRDWLGDEQPPDELNRASLQGLHFGFPACHGGTIADPELGTEQSCAQFTAPAMALDAHVASLGMRFYSGPMFPKAYQRQIFIAEHGSWNSSRKVGYRITMVQLKGNQAVNYTTFARGWLVGDTVWGRPVDLEVMPDGSMLVSDDYNGAIYRISYAQ
jgi:glucose/arabinose dehydrogenase